MPQPILLTTWTITQPAVAAAWPALSRGGSALDAVETACRWAEDDPANHTVGRGGLPDAGGNVSLDAAVMLSPSERGGVCFVRRSSQPVSIARRVMENTPHTLLAGAGAEAFAIEQGFAPVDDLLTDSAKQTWLEWMRSGKPLQPTANIEEQRISDRNHDTIGALALDQSGQLAAACSTSGLAWKLPGRVGDSPIIGHGLYCDPAVGACVCTGHGELVSGVCGSFLAVEELRRGASPIDAAMSVLQRIAEKFQLTERDQVGLIVLAREGQFGVASLRPGFSAVVRSLNEDRVCPSQCVLIDSVDRLG